MDNRKDNKHIDSPSTSSNRTSKISIRRSKSEKVKNDDQFVNEVHRTRSILSSFRNWKRNGKDSSKQGTTVSTDSFSHGLSESPKTSQKTEHRRMVTEPHAEQYFMQHKRRGRAIILDHEKFDNEDSREGNKKDVEKLTDVLSHLKFEISVHTDKEYGEILEIIKKLSKEDYTDCDCIAFFILTHGDSKRNIAAKDVYYSPVKIWGNFTTDKCDTLAGKPKLFFFNTCRGKKKDLGFRLFRGRTQADSSKPVQSYKIPNHADFLFAYSTVDDHLSYRDILNGTWYIQCLCKVLFEHYATKDLLKILTITARTLAMDYRTLLDFADDEEEINQTNDCEVTQISSFTSTLIRDVYFPV